MMTGIATSIELYDKLSTPINHMIGAINNMIGAYHSLDTAMDSGLDPGQIHQAEAALIQAQEQVDQLGEYIRQNEKKQEDFNDELEDGASAADGLGKKIMGIVGAYVGLSALKEQASQAIGFASDLQEVQNVVDVAFGSSSKVIDEWAETTLEAYGLNELSAKRFAGTMGAMLKSSGMSGDAVTDMSMKITELAGDMASFYNLEGEEAFNKLRSGISGETEPLKQLGINMSVANLEAFALSQGIKKAYSEMSQAEQVTLRYNYLLQTTQDAQGDFARTSDSFANQQKLLTENWKAFTGEIASNALPALSGAISMLNGTITFLSDNWGIISPILGGLITVIGLYTAALVTNAIIHGVQKIATIASTIASIAHGAAITSEMVATTGMTKAQLAFNAALYASPVTWILLIIIAIIAAIYLVIGVINKLTGSSISATGVIAGAIMAAVAFVWNLFLGLLDLILGIVNAIANPWISFANFFGNLFNDPIGAIIHLFGDLADRVLGIVETIAKAIDKVFGSNLAEKVQGWRSSLDSKVEAAAKKHGNGSYEKVVEEWNLSSESLGLKRWEYGDAYNTGYKWGAGIEESVSGGIEELLNPEDIATTAENTGKAADALDITNEDLKYLKDIAETEAINRFTTAEIKVDMTNNNNISNNMDLDGVVDYLTNGVNEAMEKAAEGVHE